MKKLLNSNLPCYTLPPTQHRSSLETDPLLKCYLWPRYLISKGTHVKFARFAEHELYIFTLCKRQKNRAPPPQTWLKVSGSGSTTDSFSFVR